MSVKRPLEGIRIANFGWVWAGPVVGQTLSFLGAEVYKIESKSRIDLTRNLPPFGEGVRDPDRSLSNHACWAGNGSVTLNLKKPEALDLAFELIAKCDVVVENFGPGVMNSLGLGYEKLCAAKSDIILFSMPAAGLDGPLRDVRTYGMSLSSITGVDSLVGYEAGKPIPVENAYSDPYNGVLGAFGVLVALEARKRSGKGQHVDYSQQEAVMQMVGPAFMDYALSGRVAGPMNNAHPTKAAAPHGVFPCAGEDRWIAIAVHTDEEFRQLADGMGRPDLAEDSKFKTTRDRVTNSKELDEIIADWSRNTDDETLAAELQAKGVAATPVLNVPDLLGNEQFRHRKTFVEFDHPLGFKETIYGPYVKMSDSPGRVRTGPMIGQDNEYVFKELLGIPTERYDELVTAEVIF